MVLFVPSNPVTLFKRKTRGQGRHIICKDCGHDIGVTPVNGINKRRIDHLVDKHGYLLSSSGITTSLEKYGNESAENIIKLDGDDNLGNKGSMDHSQAEEFFAFVNNPGIDHERVNGIRQAENNYDPKRVPFFGCVIDTTEGYDDDKSYNKDDSGGESDDEVEEGSNYGEDPEYESGDDENVNHNEEYEEDINIEKPNSSNVCDMIMFIILM
jgi:hypothetical protein